MKIVKHIEIQQPWGKPSAERKPWRFLSSFICCSKNKGKLSCIHTSKFRSLLYFYIHGKFSMLTNSGFYHDMSSTAPVFLDRHQGLPTGLFSCQAGQETRHSEFYSRRNQTAEYRGHPLILQSQEKATLNDETEQIRLLDQKVNTCP